jgi:predicted DNA-binding protein
MESGDGDVMTITSDMARITVRSTFALDPETVAALDRLAEKWGASKSETLRRIIDTAARVEEVDRAADARTALAELQESLGLSEEQADAWVREIRAEREAGGR